MLKLPTYTDVWEIEGRLYHVEGYSLGRGVSYEKLALYLALFVPWWTVLRLAGVPFNGGLSVVAYLILPGAGAYWLSRTKVQGKRLHQWLGSQLRYLAEPRAWHRLAPVRQRMPERISLAAFCWQPRAARARPGRARGSAPTRGPSSHRQPKAPPPPPPAPGPPRRAAAAVPPRPAARDLVPSRAGHGGTYLQSVLEQKRLRDAARRARRRRVLCWLTLGLIKPPDHPRRSGRHARRRAAVRHPGRPAQ